MKRFLLLVAVVINQGCSHSDDSEVLDIPLHPLTELNQPVDNDPHWQKFFKPPPASKERKQLKNKLSSNKKTASSLDLLRLANQAIAIGRYEEAESYFQRALFMKKDSPDVLISLAALYVRTNQPASSLSYLKRAKHFIDQTESPPLSLIMRYKYTLAMSLLVDSTRAKAHSILTEIISANPKFTPAYNALAMSYIQQGKNLAAEFVIKRGMDNNENSPHLFNLSGVLEMHQGHYAKAKQWFDKAISVEENFAAAYVNRASLQFFRAAYSSALHDLKKSLEIDPTNSEAHIMFGLCMSRLENFVAAKEHFQQAIDHDPENGFARYNLGLILAKEPARHNDAVRLFHEVLQVRNSSSNLREMATLSLEGLQQRYVINSDEDLKM